MKVPHSGYHWNCGSGRFFEGWYYRVTLPKINQSFAFMYAIDDPQGGSRFSGGSVQVLGIDDRYLRRILPNFQDFYASRDHLDLNHWNLKGEGYAASDRHNQGKIYDPMQNITCTWHYRIEPVAPQTNGATMGWMSYLPVFEPGWQILTIQGWGSGFVTWGDRLYQFQNAPVYAEKNWGRSFPEQWFWMQCNAFECDQDPNFSLITAGGKRQTLEISSEVAMVSIYFEGELYRFMPDNSEIYCEIKPWGSWEIRGYMFNTQGKQQRVEIRGETDLTGTEIMIPTAEGLKFACRDTALGKIRVRLNLNGRTIYAQSNQAALEVGGRIWQKTWRFKSASI
jgi:tocopherol cyclase